MHRSKQQLAAVRQSQTTRPLTPYSVTSGPTPTAPAAQPAPTAAELAAAKEERIEIAVRTNAQIFQLKSELSFEEKLRAQQRQEFDAEYARLQSRIERLEQDIYAQWANYNNRWVESAEFHKVKLLGLVRDGLMCTNAAAPPEQIQAEAAEKLEEMTCQTKK
jgi:hypothetical protein